jgi:hypothetical protein
MAALLVGMLREVNTLLSWIHLIKTGHVRAPSKFAFREIMEFIDGPDKNRKPARDVLERRYN